MKMQAANTKLRSDGNGGYTDQSRSHFTLLAKLVKCNCGHVMTGDYRKGRGHSGHELVVKTYRCSNHKKHNSITLPMRLLDFAVLTICLKNRTKYMEHLQSFPFQSSVEELNMRIDNLEAEKREIEKKQRLLSERFLQVRRYNVSDASFMREMDALTTESKRIEQLIQKENKHLKLLKDSKTEIAEFTEHIHAIEGDKYKTRIFVQHMVEEVRPFFRDHFYTVTEIVMRDLSFAVRTSDPDDISNGLPDKVYVILNTKNTIIPKIRYISGPCLFNTERKVFLLPNSDEATLEQVFDDEEEVYFHSLLYKPLDFDDTTD